MTSSFQRKIKPKLPEIPGVTPSIYTNHLLASSGVPDLDILLGGGLAVGTVLVLEEDISGNYSKLLLKYFLSEGLVHNHSLMVTNSSLDGKSIVQQLPSFDLKVPDEESANDLKSEDDKMKIAWRYQNQSNTKEIKNNSVSNSHTFNLLKTVPSDVLEKCDVSVFDLEDGIDDEQSTWKSTLYCKLLKEIQSKVKGSGFFIDPTVKPNHTNILRIGAQSLGSILWGDLKNSSRNLCTFLLSLRAVMRSCFGVAVITVPSTLLNSPGIREKILICSDYVVQLESFEGDEIVNQVYKDYHGLLYINKIPCLGALAPPNHLIQDPSQLVFKSKRTKFVIEKFHLPPDLSENVARDQKDKSVKATGLDF